MRYLWWDTFIKDWCSWVSIDFDKEGQYSFQWISGNLYSPPYLSPFPFCSYSQPSPKLYVSFLRVHIFCAHHGDLIFCRNESWNPCLWHRFLSFCYQLVWGCHPGWERQQSILKRCPVQREIISCCRCHWEWCLWQKYLSYTCTHRWAASYLEVMGHLLVFFCPSGWIDRWVHLWCRICGGQRVQVNSYWRCCWRCWILPCGRRRSSDHCDDWSALL